MSDGMHVFCKIYTDGKVEQVDGKMTLEQMQKFVGGYVELIPSNLKTKSLIVNEEGLLRDLPDNPKATALVSPQVNRVGYLRGNVLVVRKPRG